MYKKLFKFSTLDNYNKQAQVYISHFKGTYANRITNIENAMTLFLTQQYGYLPTAGEIEWPVLEPNFEIPTAPLISFHEAWASRRTNCIIHFYTQDSLFMRVFRNPQKYIPFFRQCVGVIGPDMSQYADMPAEMRYRHAYCNCLLSSIFQQEGINLYPNVTWSKRDSFGYSFPLSLSNSVIAINSNGVHRDGLALYRWKQGYQLALRKLTPLFIIRYGQSVDGEATEISSYYFNERLKKLRYGRKWF